MKYSEEELENIFKEAQKRYPVGTEFNVVHMPQLNKRVISVKKYKKTFSYTLNGNIHINLIVSNKFPKGATVWINGQWAKITKYPKTKNYEIY